MRVKTTLIFLRGFCMVLAMSKILIISVSIIWASLLLISWSSASPSQPTAELTIERAIY